MAAITTSTRFPPPQMSLETAKSGTFGHELRQQYLPKCAQNTLLFHINKRRAACFNGTIAECVSDEKWKNVQFFRKRS